MRDPERIPVVLEWLQEYWYQNPDLRLTQLMWFLAAKEGDGPAPNFFYTEDDALVARLINVLPGGVDHDPGTC